MVMYSLTSLHNTKFDSIVDKKEYGIWLISF